VLTLKNKEILLLGFLALVGCTPSRTATSEDPSKLPTLNVVAIDRSGSTANMRETQILALKSAFVRAADWGEEVAIYMVDREMTCLFSAEKINDDSRITKRVLDQLKEFDASRSQGTRPYNFWKEMEKQYAGKQKSVRILYLTDGDNDWKDDERLINRSLASISKNKNITIALLGLNKDAEEKIKSQFSCFGNRVTFSVGKEKAAIAAGITKWREKK
jgi:hypothetical protein